MFDYTRLTTNGSFELKHAELTDKILGIFYDVYNELGHGFLESVYEEAMCIALAEAGLRVGRQVRIPVFFRSTLIGEYVADLLIGEVVFVELKAARALDQSHCAQLIHYLRATEVEVGLLLNFGAAKPEFRRFFVRNESKKIRLNQSKSAVRFS